MVIDNIDLISVLDRSFVCNFSNIDLVQNISVDPIVFSGSGELFVRDGGLIVKVHHKYIGEEKERYFNESLQCGVGELVPDHSYYRVTGVDTSGLRWETEWSDLSGDFGIMSSVLTGRINKIRRGDLNGVPATKVILVFQGGVEFPCRAHKQGYLEIDVGGLSVRLENHEKFSTATMSGENIVQEDVDSIVQALEIASGYLLQLLAVCYKNDRASVIELHSVVDNMLNSQFFTPVPLKYPNSQKDFISLIRHLYCFLRRDESVFYGYWHKIQRAYQAGLVSAALTLTVSIESIVKHYWREFGEDLEFKLLAEKAISKVDGLDVESRIASRLKSSLTSAGSFTVKNCLRALVAKRVVEKVHLNGWDKLRNKAAHGDKIRQGPASEQEFVDLFFVNVDLLFLLVVGLVGYSGCRVNYSSRGFPVIKG